MPDENRPNQANPSPAPDSGAENQGGGDQPAPDQGRTEGQTQQPAPEPVAPPQEGTEQPQQPTEGEQPPPAAEQPAEPQEPEMTPEQASAERLAILAQTVEETEARERERLEQKYGTGFIGRTRAWLNETKAGRITKIAAKIGLGVGAALAAGVIPGAAGLVLAPLVYTLGLKTSVDGAIEAAQQFGKGRGLRLKLEAARQDLSMEAIGAKYHELVQSLESAGTDEAARTEAIGRFVEAIQAAEQAVIAQEKEVAVLEKAQAAFRAKWSMVGAIAITVMTGVPLGLQNFDGEKAAHMVRLGFRGFQFIQQSGAQIFGQVGAIAHQFTAQHVVLFGHAALAGKTLATGAAVVNVGATAAGYAGVGLAGVGLFAAAAREKKMAERQAEEAPATTPEYVTRAEKYKRRAPRGRATTAQPGAPSAGPAQQPETAPPPIDVSGISGFSGDQPTGEEAGAPPRREPTAGPAAAEPAAAEAGARVPPAAEGETSLEEQEKARTPEQTLSHLKTLQLSICRLTVEIKQAEKNKTLTGAEMRPLREEMRQMLDERDSIIEILGLMDDTVYDNWYLIWENRLISQAVVERFSTEEGGEAQEKVKRNTSYIERHAAEATDTDNQFLDLLRKKKEAEAGGGETAAAA